MMKLGFDSFLFLVLFFGFDIDADFDYILIFENGILNFIRRSFSTHSSTAKYSIT